MDETILLPSPNWFLVSCMSVTTDGWVIYGSPSKSLCVLEPLDPNHNVVINDNGYRAHLFGRVHGDRVTSIDISPTWPEKKFFISGAADGSVKLWSLQKVENTVNIKYKYSHSMHLNEREDVVGVGYSRSYHAVTVGSYGRIVKWDLQSNIVKTYNVILSKFKPTCMVCSPHRWLHVAIGTKQGVVLVVDLNDTGTVIFKVRSHDDEILSVSWCPQYRVATKKKIKEVDYKNTANKRLEKIRQEANKQQEEQLDDSALTKTLPEDSFDETVVEEEDLFDVYKDHEEEEFGHKKYIPEVVVVKEKEPISTEFDYLAECQKLKDKITQIKEEPEPSITSLVEAFDKTHVVDNEDSVKVDKKSKKKAEKEIENVNGHEFYKQGAKHLLATIGKQGTLRVWSNTGKLMGSAMQNRTHISNKISQPKVNQPLWATVLWYKPDVLLSTDAKGQILQCNPLTTDSRNKIEWRVVDLVHKRGTFLMVSNAPRAQLGCGVKEGSQGNQTENVNQTENDNESLDSNQCLDPQQSNTPALPEDQWCVWTAAQDRSVVCYSMTKRKKISIHNTCGGFVYNLQVCPYDARKVAVCVGDGAIRIWEMGISADNDEKLTYGQVSSFWQNVQGKVLVSAWHPTRENIIAFGTAEARVGILDISGNNVEKPARVINIGVSGSVYSVCWGEGNDLYVSSGGDIVMCSLKKDIDPKRISVRLDGDKWRVTAVSWYPAGLLCGSFNGSVALLSNTTYEIIAVNFLFKKLINSLEWHPQFTSSSSEESSFKNLVAVCSMDKNCQIAILKHSQNEDGKHQLETLKLLEGHKGTVMQLAWSPHHEGRLASTSSDSTVRVWDVDPGTCMAIFSRHAVHPISVAWNPFPHHSNVLMSGGSDYCVRLWKLEDYPPEAYKETLPVPLPLLPKKERRKRIVEPERPAEGDKIEIVAEEAVDADDTYGEGREADEMALRLKVFKKFLLPISATQMNNCTARAARKLAEKAGADAEDSDDDSETEYDMDFIKIFGTTNEFNELLDYEMQCHLEGNDTDAWIMLAVFRGQIDTMIQFANENDLLCPFLVSLAPCVSFKYWKDVTQLYLEQINRLVAQKREHKLMQTRAYGGAVFRKAALLLAVHNVRGAVDCLVEARLFRDAYMLCRARHMESIARELLYQWLKDAITSGHLKVAVLCYIVLGDMNKASAIIAGMTRDEESWLSLAADLAKMTGQHTFADHLEDKKEQIKQAPNNQEVEDNLPEIPTRMELFLRNNIFTNTLTD